MTDAPSLTRGQRAGLWLAVGLVVAGMLIGFTSSFITLAAAASRQDWRYPALLPLSVDSGILAYVLLDHLAIGLGSKSRWLHLVAWALAAFTVWANAAVAPAHGLTWRVIHAAMPALWVLGVEALRFTWRRLHAMKAQGRDSIPLARWLLAPAGTFLLWRRMVLWQENSYARALGREQLRRQAVARLRAEHGTSWRKAADQSVVWQLTTGIDVEGAADAVGKALAAPVVSAPAVPAASVPAAPAAPRNAAPSATGNATGTEGRAATRTASAIRKVKRQGAGKSSDDDIRNAIREMYEGAEPVTKYRVMKTLSMGNDRAGRLLAEVAAERPSLAVAR